jgi:two-component system, LuxR family, response regulator FixJ
MGFTWELAVGPRGPDRLTDRRTQVADETYYRPFPGRERLVHIFDADPGTCEALSVLFRLEGFNTSFSVDAASFFAGIERRRPDAVLINMRPGPDDGIAVLRRFKAMRTGTPVFMLEDEADVDAAVEAMKAGATGVVTKPVDTDALVRSVVEALDKDVRLGPTLGGRRPVEVRGFALLTPREREVLELITNGQSNKEAGRLLGISPRTIEVHRARVMEKLGARNTADLMRIVLTS